MVRSLNIYKLRGVEDYGGVVSPDFKNFVRLYKNHINRICKRNGWRLVKFSPNHYYASWFIKNDNNQCIYMSFSDVRYFDKSWYNSILYRVAKDECDFNGSSNWYSDMDSLESNIQKMFKRGY